MINRTMVLLMSAGQDPFGAIAVLPGVGAAAEHARAAIDALRRHPAIHRGLAQAAAASAVLGGTASAALAGADPDDVADPIVQGALRVTADSARLAAIWERSPGQVLARLHMLAARDLAEPPALGRPRPGSDPARLELLLQLASGRSAAPGVVIAALIHGELLALDAFQPGGGLVARAAERVVLVASGVDPGAVSVPEAGHLQLQRGYAELLEPYASGKPTGVGAWVRHCCEAYAGGAETALAHASGAPRLTE